MLQGFIDHISLEKRYSEHTRKAYLNDLKQFARFVRAVYEVDILSEVAAISHIHIRSWMVELAQNGISNRAINRKLSTLRSFFNYLRRKKSITKDPMLKIVTPKVGKRLPKFIQEKNTELLWDFETEGMSFSELRDMLVVRMLYTTGIRRSELIGMRFRDIDLVKKEVKVLGKGKKERIVPIIDDICPLIKLYEKLKTEEFLETEVEDWFFLTNKGAKLYPKMVYDIVKRYLSLVSTAKDRSPHVLRHSFATHLMNHGADLNAVKELLGHASLAATQVYTHNSIDKLKEIHRKAHPRGVVKK